MTPAGRGCRAARSLTTALTVAFLAVVATGCAPAGTTDIAPASAMGPRLYVASQEGASVAVIDPASGQLVQTVDLTALGFSPTSKPHHVAVEPDGSHWYVSLIAAGKVLKFDRMNRLVGQADFETPGMLALDPEGGRLFVGRSMAAVNPPQRIGVIDRASMAIEEVDVFFPRPHAIALDPDRGRLWVASLGENRMAQMPTDSEDPDLLTVPGDHLQMLVQFAVSPDGHWLVAGGQMTGDLLVWDVSGAEPVLHTTVHVGGQPWHPTFAPDGTEVWVPNQTAGSVTVVRTSDWAVDAVVKHPGLAEPHGSAISADGLWVFVSGHNTSGSYGGSADHGTVTVIDRATRRVERVLEVGPYAAGMGLPPLPLP